jgi:MYXO-CTERM domain-containing protein
VLDSDNVDLINNTTYQNAQSNGETQDSPEGELYARFASNVRFLNNVIVARPGLRATQADTQLVNVSYDHNIYFDGDTDVLTPHPTGANDRKLDPLLVAPTLGQSADLRLRAESPAIDTGTLTAAPTTDLEGRARPHGAAIDLGAYEFGGVLPQQGTGGTSGTGGSASAPSGGQPSDPATGDASTTGGAGGEADPAPDSQDSAEWQDYGEGPRGCACTSGRGGSGRSRILWPAALLLVAFVRRRSARAMSSARTRAS